MIKLRQKIGHDRVLEITSVPGEASRIGRVECDQCHTQATISLAVLAEKVKHNRVRQCAGCEAKRIAAIAPLELSSAQFDQAVHSAERACFMMLGAGSYQFIDDVVGMTLLKICSLSTPPSDLDNIGGLAHAIAQNMTKQLAWNFTPLTDSDAKGEDGNYEPIFNSMPMVDQSTDHRERGQKAFDALSLTDRAWMIAFQSRSTNGTTVERKERFKKLAGMVRIKYAELASGPECYQ
jgi:hypothetical protein